MQSILAIAYEALQSISSEALNMPLHLSKMLLSESRQMLAKQKLTAKRK